MRKEKEEEKMRKKKDKQRYSFMDALAIRKHGTNKKILKRFRKLPMRSGVEQSQFRF